MFNFFRVLFIGLFLNLVLFSSQTSAQGLDPIHDAADRRDLIALEKTGAKTSEDETVREIYAEALGRIGDETTIKDLVDLLSDKSPLVQKKSAWAIGQLSWAFNIQVQAVPNLLHSLKNLLGHPNELVRAAAAESLGKVGDSSFETLLLMGMKDGSPLVRESAVYGLYRSVTLRRQRLGPDTPGASAEILDHLATLSQDKSQEVRSAVAFYLSRIREEKAHEALAELSTDPSLVVRLFALTGLSNGTVADAVAILVNQLNELFLSSATSPLTGEQVLVGVACINSLSTLKMSDKIPEKGFSALNWQIRAAIATATSSTEKLDILVKDVSPTVRGSAIRSQARLMNSEAAALWLEGFFKGEVDSVQIAITEAIPKENFKDKEEFLMRLLKNEASDKVKGLLIQHLSGIPSASASQVIKESLKSESLSLRLAAVSALANRDESEKLSLLVETYQASKDKFIFTWIRQQIIKAVAKDTSKEATLFLESVVSHDPVNLVSDEALKILKVRSPNSPWPEPTAKLSRSPYRDLDTELFPQVEIETSKGKIVIELNSRAAPIHVSTFLGMVEDGRYNGLPWHRWVSNFLIQGGDPTQSGSGNAGWVTRNEFSDQRFLRGSIGIARMNEIDSGVSQFWFAHLPLPHLEGRYTYIGRILSGLEIMDNLERGDLMISAKILKSSH